MLKGYKTVLFNAVMMVVAFFSMQGSDSPPTASDVSTAIDLADAALVSVWGIGNWILRHVTDSPVFWKDE